MIPSVELTRSETPIRKNPVKRRKDIMIHHKNHVEYPKVTVIAGPIRIARHSWTGWPHSTGQILADFCSDVIFL